MNKVTVIPVALLALTSGLAFGSQGDGHAGGNGGDPTLLRAKLIRQYINSDLRNDAQQYFKTIDLTKISNVAAQRALESMKDRDVAADIADSNYILRDSCSDVGGQAAGGAMLNDLGGNICLSPKRLAEVGSSKAEIVGLAIHEHAHHFGYSDKDYAIYGAVFKTVSLKDPEWKTPEFQPSPKPTATPIVHKSYVNFEVRYKKRQVSDYVFEYTDLWVKPKSSSEWRHVSADTDSFAMNMCGAIHTIEGLHGPFGNFIRKEVGSSAGSFFRNSYEVHINLTNAEIIYDAVPAFEMNYITKLVCEG
jgi:hypothetical protein